MADLRKAFNERVAESTPSRVGWAEFCFSKVAAVSSHKILGIEHAGCHYSPFKQMPTVLLIDQDDKSRRATAGLFTEEDWKVLEASGGDDGMELALRDRPEIILCDSLMPQENGFRVCRALREQLHPARIIMISDQSYSQDREAALQAGADEYWVKPVTSNHVVEELGRIRANGVRRDAAEKIPATPVSAVTRVRFWGVRGSIPVPGPTTVRYGGNTSCVEVRADGEIIVLDAGSGIRSLGLALEKEFGDDPIQLSLLLTHSHWDHIQGLPFFLPAYKQKNKIRVLGYEGAQAGLGQILANQMETPFFPVNMRDLPSNIAIEELKEMEFQIGRVRVCSKFLNHPGICAGYRLYTSAGSVAFLPDNEPYERLKLQDASDDHATEEEARSFAAAEHAKLVEFLSGVDLLLNDTQYTDQEYEGHIGWGHGSLSSAVDLALDAHARKLLLFHHDPSHDDDMIDRMVTEARGRVTRRGGTLEVDAAREGRDVVLGQH